MKFRHLLLTALLCAPFSLHAQTKISALPSASSVTGPELIPCDQTGVTVTCTPTMIQNFITSNLIVANTQLSPMAADTTKCNPAGSSGTPTDCTVSQMQSMLGITSGTSLPSATLPLTGSEAVNLFQGGSAKQTPANALNGFISGTYTSAQVLANFPPASNAGRSVYATDFGTLLVCDGIRWNVTGTPAVPPGAMAFGYTHNVFTILPTVADIGYGTTPGTNRIYAGYLGLNSSTSAGFTTASNGQLQLIYSGTSGQNGMFTIVPYHTAVLAGDYGQLGLALGSQGFYVEIAYTDSSNNTDIQDTLFVEPQEHNPLKVDAPGGSYPSLYEEWHELDINESGHGTDYGGAYRGAYIKWAGKYGGTYTLASAPGMSATTITFASPGWQGDSYPDPSHPVTLKFNSGETRNINPTHGSAGPYTLSSPLSSAETTAVSLSGNGYFETMLSNNIQTTSLDYTSEHIFGGAYDPIGHTLTIWQDGVMQSQVTTSDGANSDVYRDSLHYMIVVATQSRGAHFAHTMNVREVSMWVP